jgi:small subunit ribosomal protein S16
MGRRHRPFFRINAVDSRTPRDGRILEKVGYYDPLEKDVDKQIVLEKERVEFWLGQGAVPTDTVSEILLRQGIKHKYAAEKKVRRNKARTVAHKKGRLFTKTERVLAEKKKAEQEAQSKGQGEAAAGGAAQS